MLKKAFRTISIIYDQLLFLGLAARVSAKEGSLQVVIVHGIPLLPPSDG